MKTITRTTAAPDILDEVFAEENLAPAPTFMKWNDVGDSILGAFVTKTTRAAISNEHGDFEPQIIYHLDVNKVSKVQYDETGEIRKGVVCVGVNESKTPVHSYLENVEKDEIVGFKFTEKRGEDTDERSASHIIRPTIIEKGTDLYKRLWKA